MTTRYEGPTGWRRAAFSHVEDAVRRLMVVTPPRSRTIRNLAFHRYGKQVRRILRAAPVELELVSRSDLAVGERSTVAELSLVTSAAVAPGDVLSLWWRNSEQRVASVVRPAGGVMASPGKRSDGRPAADELVPAESLARRYWTTPLPHRPSRLTGAPVEELLREVVDLSGAATDLLTAPRIVPRFFTTSHAAVAGGRTELRLQVTRQDGWPERAAAYLSRVEPGEKLRGWVLPHPHRVPPGPGMAIVTGSGAASVFASLRAGARGVRLLWGLGDKRLAPWAEAELQGWLASGALAELELAHSPQRVTDLLRPHSAELRGLIDDGGWVFVSGNEAMGRDVDLIVGDALGEHRYRASYEAMRCIVST